MSIREIAQNFHNFCPKYFPPLSEFSHILLLPKFFHCFCPNFGKKQWQFRETAMGNSGKSNGKIWAKAMRKLGKRRAYISGKNYCFCPNFPLLLPEFPTAFARIFRFQFFLGGGTVPPCPPPPASYAYADLVQQSRRNWDFVMNLFHPSFDRRETYTTQWTRNSTLFCVCDYWTKLDGVFAEM